MALNLDAISSIEILFNQRKHDLVVQYNNFCKKRVELYCRVEFTEQQYIQLENNSCVYSDELIDIRDQAMIKCSRTLVQIKDMIEQLKRYCSEIQTELTNLTHYMSTFRLRHDLFKGIRTPHITITSFRQQETNEKTQQLIIQTINEEENDYDEIFKQILVEHVTISLTPGNHFSPNTSFVSYNLNNIFVGDSSNHSIKYFSSKNLTTTTTITTKELSVKVALPVAIASINESTFYIADKDRHCVHIVDVNSNTYKFFGGYGSENGKFNEPTSIAIEGNSVYVADGLNSRIQVFNLDGIFHSSLSIPKQRTPFYPQCILFVNNQLIVVDNWGSSIFVIDPKQKKIQNLIATYGNSGGNVKRPSYAAVDNNGRLYVSDTGNKRIIAFDNNNTFLRALSMEESCIEGAPLGISVQDKTLVFTTTNKDANIYFIGTRYFTR